MGKKSKRPTKATGAADRQGPGKARREKAAALKDIETRIVGLIEKLESELEGVELYGPLAEREDCPICCRNTTSFCHCVSR
mmetsp:Transcript_673/g.1897  ORF Transcript_673/g.1897 Transcript_673/m.1897 type:complete len:81 (-) Transcript_673:1115-1357(-)